VSDSKSVYIFGYSGHSYVIIDSLLALGYDVLGYFDLKKAAINPFNLNYLGCELKVNVGDIVKNNLVFPSVGDNSIRNKLVDFFNTNNLNQFTIVDPSAHVSKWATVGKSTYVGKSVQVNAAAFIGNGVILNTSCVIEHECKIENGVHVAPGSILCGNVCVGENSFIGALTVIIPNKTISKGILIGAGSVVVSDLVETGVYFGNPAKLKRNNLQHK
jgi:sugar O-acyltransferase (sialic acid O-acetyltransferase NeuD family)